jgi:hypothetical protein
MPLIVVEEGSIVYRGPKRQVPNLRVLLVKQGASQPVVFDNLIFAEEGSIDEVPEGYELIELAKGAPAPAIVPDPFRGGQTLR